MLRSGDVLANRFVARGDEQQTLNARRTGARMIWRRGEKIDLTGDPALWLRGIDRVTGDPVLIEPRGMHHLWGSSMLAEAQAQLVAAATPRFVAPVLHVRPGVVYGEPPAGAPRGAFSPAEAAALALQVCEAAAHLHAMGIADLCFDPFNLRVIGTGADARIHWLVPGVSDLESIAFFERVKERSSRIQRRDGSINAIEQDILRAIDFFFALLPAEAHSSKHAVDLLPLRRILDDSSHPVPASMAALAETFRSLSSSSAGGTDHIAAMPVVTSLPAGRLDWDALIAGGEVELGRMADPSSAHYVDYIALPLAAAYHQRASRAAARGDKAAALRDCERALELDPDWLPYAATRAVLLDALGQGKEALGFIDRAIAKAEEASQRKARIGDTKAPSSAELARAHAARGTIAIRCGKPAKAASDLRRAAELHPAAPHFHGLGAALYATGDFEGAAEADGRAVELGPVNARYRWALVASLRRLGRDRDALAQAEAIVAMEPDVASHRARLAVLSKSTARGGPG